jgi:hypothetical protein
LTKTDKKKGAIFRMEEVDGKLYRVMYFKNDKGGLTRSKFIREVNRKEKKINGKRERSKNNQSRSIKNTKLIMENRQQINNNTQQINRNHQQSQNTTQVSNQTHKYIRPSGASQSIINEWVNRSKK